MMDRIIPWYQQKTFWTAVAALAAAAGGYVTGEIGLPALIASVFGALAVIFGRQGIEKSTYIPELKDRGEEVK
jgi:hypothetical protein